jgi:hypothetical protein
METRALKGPTDYRTINMVARTLVKYIISIIMGQLVLHD